MERSEWHDTIPSRKLGCWLTSSGTRWELLKHNQISLQMKTKILPIKKKCKRKKLPKLIGQCCYKMQTVRWLGKIKKLFDDCLGSKTLNVRPHGLRIKRSCITYILDLYDRVSYSLEDRDTWIDFVVLTARWHMTFCYRSLVKLELEGEVRGGFLRWIKT